MKYLLFAIILLSTISVSAQQDDLGLNAKLSKHICFLLTQTKADKIKWMESLGGDFFQYTYSVKDYFATMIITKDQAKLTVKRSLVSRREELVLNGNECTAEIFSYLSSKAVVNIDAFLDEAEKEKQ